MGSGRPLSFFKKGVPLRINVDSSKSRRLRTRVLSSNAMSALLLVSKSPAWISPRRPDWASYSVNHWASSVILTDLSEGLELLQKNIELNSEDIPSIVRAQELAWGNVDQAKCIETPDIILVADCVYYRKSLSDLVITLKEISKDGAMVLLSYEEQSSTESPSLQQNFFTEMEQHFTKEEIPHEHHHPVFQSPEIHFFKFLRKEPQASDIDEAHGS